MRQKIWTYGLISGAILLAAMFGLMPVWERTGNYQLAEIVGYATMVIALSTIFFAVRQHRDQVLGGQIRFKEAFLLGLYIALVASAVYVIGWMLYISIVDNSFMETYYQHYLEQLRNSGQPAEEIEAQIRQMEEYKDLYRKPWVQVGVTFMEIFPVGLLIALLSAALLRRSTPATT